jgi:O-antigen ligase
MVLGYAVLTMWIPARWALSGLEAAIFVLAFAVLVRGVRAQERPRIGVLAALALLPCGWAALQLGMRWTVVRADTRNAWLYWMAAGCLVALGSYAGRLSADRESFLKSVLAIGSLISVAGLIQMFTAGGRIFWHFDSGYDTRVIGPFVSPNNYAAFVELLVPIALAFAFQRTANANLYLLLAAVLGASVAAAGSRAGTILVGVETAAAFFLRAHVQRRMPVRSRHGVIFGLLAAVFVLVFGYQSLWDRFRDDRNPYALRREYLQSSVAMFRAQPWHGFGMGTWPDVYPQFALMDTGTTANHGHNEWAQWAAEGGWPLLLLTAGIFLAVVRPAIRSVWGIGILSILVHSWVDYPFLRLGLAAWIFTLLGVLESAHAETTPQRFPGIPARGLAYAALPLLLLAIFQTSELAWADTLFRKESPADLAQAVRIEPDNALYHFALAQSDPPHAVQHLKQAVACNPYLTKARLALAAELEWRGDSPASEAMLLAAAQHDRLYAPAWALAGFYFRQHRTEPALMWARTAAGIGSEDMSSLFDLCLESGGDGQTVLDRVAGATAPARRQYLSFLMARRRMADAHAAALRIAAAAEPGDRDILLHYVDGSLVEGRAGDSMEVWNRLCARRHLPYGEARVGGLVNGDFAQPILNRGWDWMPVPTAGILTARLEDAALRIAFSGNQPEQAEMLSHFLALQPGVAYRLRFDYRTEELPQPTGVFWSVADQRQSSLSATEDWRQAEWQFRARQDLMRLVLGYRREPGTTRGAGKLLVRKIELQQEPL